MNTALTDFDCKTLSNVSFLIMKRVKYLQSIEIKHHMRIEELERLLIFNTQVLEAFSKVKSEDKVLES